MWCFSRLMGDSVATALVSKPGIHNVGTTSCFNWSEITLLTLHTLGDPLLSIRHTCDLLHIVPDDTADESMSYKFIERFPHSWARSCPFTDNSLACTGVHRLTLITSVLPEICVPHFRHRNTLI